MPNVKLKASITCFLRTSLNDQNYFFRCFRMSPENFEMLLSWIGPKVTEVTKKMCEPISVCQRLCVALRCLVTGDAHVTIAAGYRMSSAAIGRIVKETFAVTLREKCPNTELFLVRIFLYSD